MADSISSWDMDVNLMQFDIDRRIDPSALDVECIKQPDRFFHYAELAIRARELMDNAELEMDRIQAELELRVRRRPEKYDLDKPTEASIKAVVTIHPRYKDAVDRYHAIKVDSATLDKVVMAMEMKKRMIEALITLHGQQYFAGPSTPRDLKDAWSKQQQEADRRFQERQRMSLRKRGGKVRSRGSDD